MCAPVYVPSPSFLRVVDLLSDLANTPFGRKLNNMTICLDLCLHFLEDTVMLLGLSVSVVVREYKKFHPDDFTS